LCNRDIGRLVCNFQTFQLGPRGYSHVHIIPTDNLVPHACDPLEGTWGSGIIRFREESDWSLIWNVQFNFSQDSRLLATDYPRASRSFPRISGSGNKIDRLMIIPQETQVPFARACLWLLGQARANRTSMNGFDLFWVWNILW
jgi:hypothetical protein